MRLVFMGTPQIAADILPELAERYDVVGVFTRPDAVRGRGKKLVASCVKQKALELGLDVYTPETFKDGEVAKLLSDLQADAACVVAFGALLPKELLDIPRYGFINAHMSLLPRWRGAAPVERGILSGDEYAGVSIMRVEEGLDTGAYCLQAKVEIDGKSLAVLQAELVSLAAQGFIDALELMEQGAVVWREQDEAGVTYASKLEKSELLLDPKSSAWENVARVRASSEAHPARAVLEGRPLTVLEACEVDAEDAGQECAGLEAGQAIFARKRLFARAADGIIELKTVKPDGKKAMDVRSFAAGIQGIKGKTLSWERA